ncbi:hypothetical protein D3C71_1522000 [compost metagenome]
MKLCGQASSTASTSISRRREGISEPVLISRSNSVPVASSINARMPCKAATFRSTTGSKCTFCRIGLPNRADRRSVIRRRLIEIPCCAWLSTKRVERTSALSIARPICAKPTDSVTWLKMILPAVGMTKVISSRGAGKATVKSP